MNGELVDVNPAYARIIGRTVEETKKLTYWDITPESYRADEQRQLEQLKKNGQYGPFEKEYIHKDGHLVPVSLKGQLLERDGKQLIWSNVEDISARKLAENQTQTHVERLQKLAELSMTLTGDPSDVFRKVAGMIGELLDVRVVCLSERDSRR
jgi:PAS domain S-box-containing protein